MRAVWSKSMTMQVCWLLMYIGGFSYLEGKKKKESDKYLIRFYYTLIFHLTKTLIVVIRL